jgi:uncharacterized protein YukE
MDDIVEEGKWESLYQGIVEANKALQAQVLDLQKQLSVLYEEKKQWTGDKVKQSDIIQQTLDQRNKAMNEVLEENQKLKEELRKLKDGN